ncbi:MAG: DUF1294 domain-containing protein [Clostridia bacterium]|nr:DUF1294 domain-containing protein [Clostridia bacterium]
MDYGIYIILIYAVIIAIISIIATIADKIKSKSNKRRIKESTLLWFGFLGGAGIMYLTMKIIRHKTRKKKFMITLPIFFVIHILMAVAIFYLYPDIFSVFT